MLLTIDIGNTNITFGGYKSDNLKFVFRLETNNTYNCDEYKTQIENLITVNGYTIKDIDDIIISSVVPKALGKILASIKTFSKCVPLVINHKLNLGININTDHPELLGSDFIATGVAANKLYPLPVAIFDFGTATKFSVIDEDHNFLGASITAGIGISLNTLFSSAAKLSPIDITTPKHAIGTNTKEAISSGIIFGSAAFVDGMAERIKKEIGTMPTLILTGGFSNYIYGNTTHNMILAPDLILDGLKIIYDMNKIKC